MTQNPPDSEFVRFDSSDLLLIISPYSPTQMKQIPADNSMSDDDKSALVHSFLNAILADDPELEGFEIHMIECMERFDLVGGWVGGDMMVFTGKPKNLTKAIKYLGDDYDMRLCSYDEFRNGIGAQMPPDLYKIVFDQEKSSTDFSGHGLN